MNTLFSTLLGQFKLHRYPQTSLALQAFDAADEYILNSITAKLSPTKQQHILILNDQFGALACSLAKHGVIFSSGDSYLAKLALQQNLTINQIDQQLVSFIPSTENLSQNYDIVLIRIPKTLALLEQQLINLQSHITKQTIIIAGAMLKHLSKKANILFEKYIGTVQASLAVKKARLLQIIVQEKKAAISPYPTQYYIDKPQLSLINYANVFCREGLDIGSRALIPHLPKTMGEHQVADLGCGNGVLAMVYAQHNPNAIFTLTDESYMAIASAQENWKSNISTTTKANIYVNDGLADIPTNSLDIVLCNPPFHQQQTIGEYLAYRMFKQAHQSLKNRGQLWIVCNRHLHHPSILKKMFSTVTQVHQTSKFLVLKTIK